MHRSGTSMMSGILTRLGLFPGGKDRLIKGDEHNQKGYYEDRIIVDCNEQILSDAINIELPEIHDAECFLNRKTLDGLGWLYGAWLNETLVNRCTFNESNRIEEAIQIYRKGLKPGQICLIKDPRMSLTLNKWSEKIEVSAAIVMLRNPADVALSLYNRDRITANISYNIWQLYNFKALLAVENIPHLIIDYDNFLKNTEKTMVELLSFLEVVNHKPENVAINSILEFVEEKLNHSNKKKEFTPPSNLLEIYDHLRDYEYRNMNIQYSDCYEVIKNDWRSAMYVAAIRKGSYLINDLRNRIDRINAHAVTGNLLKLMRKIKKDPTFGTYDNI
jgi:hypothetical protein